MSLLRTVCFILISSREHSFKCANSHELLQCYSAAGYLEGQLRQVLSACHLTTGCQLYAEYSRLVNISPNNVRLESCSFAQCNLAIGVNGKTVSSDLYGGRAEFPLSLVTSEPL